MTRRRFFKFAVAGCTLWSGCGLKLEPPVRVGANIWPGYECLFIARSLGFFEPKPIKLVEYPSAPEVIRAFKNRAIELAALSGDEFLRLAAEEPGLRAILVTDFSRGADALVARKGLNHLNDLRGKKIGVEVNSFGVYMLARTLKKAGLTREDIEIVPVENDQHLRAFVEGRVDAVVTFEPHRTKLLKGGGKVLFDSSALSGEMVKYLVTREALLKKRPDAVKKVVEAWFKARERLLSEGEEMARLVSSREGVTPAEFLKSLELIEIPSRDRNEKLLACNGKSWTNLRNTHRILVENGLFQGAMPGDALFNERFLP